MFVNDCDTPDASINSREYPVAAYSSPSTCTSPSPLKIFMSSPQVKFDNEFTFIEPRIANLDLLASSEMKIQ